MAWYKDYTNVIAVIAAIGSIVLFVVGKTETAWGLLAFAGGSGLPRSKGKTVVLK